MKKSLAHLNAFRRPLPGTTELGDDTCGCFFIPRNTMLGPAVLIVIFSGGIAGEAEWEHLSAHGRIRSSSGTRPSQFTPSWDDMCFLKDIFWEPEEAVMQLHPPRSQYVNTHKHTLHLWRPWAPVSIPLPPKVFV
jgi:hypothetical protein